VNTKTDRRNFLKTIAAGTLALSTSAFAAKSEKPNIIFIMVDDLGKEWLSCYGSEDMKTPNLDRLAKTGMRFNNAYSMPKCTPTRATILTGQYPFTHGWVNHWDVPRWGAGCHFDWKHNTSFATIMKSAGYKTCAAGKWQISDFRVQPDAMTKHGFDDYCMWTGFESGNKPSSQRYWDPYLHTKSGSKTYQGQFSTDIFVDFIISFLKKNKEKPMMIYFPMCLTHGPDTSTPLDPDAESKEEKFRAMVKYIDISTQKIVDALDKLKIRDNTILIFTTDNGTGGSHSAKMNGRLVKGGKGSKTEEGACNPFIVNGPGLVPSGVVTDALTDFTDMLPTFAELGGAKIPKGLKPDGVSIAKLLTGKEKDSSRKWIMAMGGGSGRLTENGVVPAVDYAKRIIRNKRYQLLVGEDRKAIAIFELKTDPAQQNNLIDSKDPKTVAARKELETIAKSFPKKDAAPKYDPTPPQPWDKKLKKK
jgi:arylsulfatase A-like enzyme